MALRVLGSARPLYEWSVLTRVGAEMQLRRGLQNRRADAQVLSRLPPGEMLRGRHAARVDSLYAMPSALSSSASSPPHSVLLNAFWILADCDALSLCPLLALVHSYCACLLVLVGVCARARAREALT